MTLRNLLFLGLTTTLFAIGGCKKDCSFPLRQDGNRCWEIRDDLIGQYHGTAIYTDIEDNVLIGYRYKDHSYKVMSQSNDLTELYIGGFVGHFDESGNIVFPMQEANPGLYEGAIVSGTGYFGDTLIDRVPKKFLAYDILFVDSNKSIASKFVGVR